MTQQKSTTPTWVAYIGWFVTGLIFLATEKNDEDLRWHAANSIGFSILVALVCWIPFIGWVASVGAFVLWILLMVKANQGERMEIPFVSEKSQQWFGGLFK